MIILGISGKKKVGKDTLAIIIKQHTSLKVERIGFADALKLEVAQACHVPVKEIEQQKDLYRTILQWWGTEFRRGQDDSYWVKKFLERCNVSTADLIIVPDVRFQNEYDIMKKLGAPIIRVTRSQYVSDFHRSETELDTALFDYNHHNTTIDDLRAFAKILLSRITNIP